MSTDHKDQTPDLGQIASDAEQQAADLQALLETIIDAHTDPTGEFPRVMRAIARLLEPISDHLTTLSWELMRDAPPAQPATEEGQA